MLIFNTYHALLPFNGFDIVSHNYSVSVSKSTIHHKIEVYESFRKNILWYLYVSCVCDPNGWFSNPQAKLNPNSTK